MHNQLLDVLRRERDLSNLETEGRGLWAGMRALKVEEERYRMLTPQSSLLTTVRASQFSHFTGQTDYPLLL